MKRQDLQYWTSNKA